MQRSQPKVDDRETSVILTTLARRVGLHSENAIAQRAGLSPQVVRKVSQAGLGNIHFSTIAALAEAFDMTPSAFVEAFTQEVVSTGPFPTGQWHTTRDDYERGNELSGSPSLDSPMIDVLSHPVFLKEPFLVEEVKRRAHLKEFPAIDRNGELLISSDTLLRLPSYIRQKLAEMSRLDRVARGPIPNNFGHIVHTAPTTNLGSDGWTLLKTFDPDENDSTPPRDIVVGDIRYRQIREKVTRNPLRFAEIAGVLHRIRGYLFWFMGDGSEVRSTGHVGWEDVFVLEGAITFEIEVAGQARKYRLNKFDSIDFDGTLPHTARATTDNTQCLVDSCIPDFGLLAPRTSSIR